MKEAKIRQIVRGELVREIGETTETYSWKLYVNDRFGAHYGFKTEDYEYTVSVEEFIPEYAAVEFGVDDAAVDQAGTDFSVVTDEGSQFKVVATAVDIARHAWENREEIFSDDYWPKLRGFAVDAASKQEGEKSIRARLYKKFIKKQFPQAEIENVSDTEFRVNLRT